MKIKREFCGQTIEIELTPEEIRDAYLIEQHSNDMEDIKDYLARNNYRVDEIPEVFMHGFANALRKRLDQGQNYDMAFDGVEREDHKNILSYYEEDE